MATFFVSGLLHEYVLAVIALKGRVASAGETPYRPAYGMHFAFFLWNGFVMLLENVFHDCKLVDSCKESLPRWAMTALVLLTVIPISHWFTDEYATSGFYDDYSMGLPILVRINDSNT